MQETTMKHLAQTYRTIAISDVGPTLEQIQNSGNHVGEIKQAFVLLKGKTYHRQEKLQREAADERTSRRQKTEGERV